MTETADQARTRRRWVTLAEVVAVAGVVIAALTLYSNWADRRADQAERVATATSEARDKARVDLTGTVQAGGERITLHDARHDLSDVTVAFPQALGVSPQSPADAAIDSSWFKSAMLKLTDGGADDRTGRLPVLVTVRYWVGDSARTATSIQDVVWKTEGRRLLGRSFKLEGLRLRQRGGTPAALEAAWAKEKPTR